MREYIYFTQLIYLVFSLSPRKEKIKRKKKTFEYLKIWVEFQM